MNHEKCINDVLARYNDFPSIQKDMRKLLRYVESQFRMFMSPIFKKTDTDNAIDAIMEPYATDQEAQAAFTGVALAIRHVLTDPEAPQKIKNILDSLAHRPELAAAVRQAGQLLTDSISEDIPNGNH